MKTYNEFKKLNEARTLPREFESSEQFEDFFHKAYSIMQSSAMMDWARETDMNYGRGNVDRLRRVHSALDDFYDGLMDE
ncbi:hypothetical protein VPFG_00365 [Vibrio phage nt-1]|uniref:Uncharacterized protein n=1 Tax=Vibrio phage nt-1 TaxID=115992 RepID=R9TJU3_9CAUD|nr:hypothetical protein VPFG_00365 [Vibrio phage nt-1]AGN30362.1 hypothetical protein VPFG_00365 [Vibrio phage nt-1]